MPDVNEDFLRIARERGFYSEELIKRIAEEGHIHFPEVPTDVQRTFVTAHDISPEWHVRMQAAFQEFVDSAISKTTNFPHGATQEDVREIYELAFKLNAKGVTVYRDGSRDHQVLSTGATKSPAPGLGEAERVAELEKQIATLQGELRRATERAVVAEAASQPVRRQKQRRPAMLRGTTRKMASPIGDVYVTINEDDDHVPFEVFATLGKAGSVAMADTEAIGRLISLALRFGIPISEVHGQLRGISSDRAIGFGENKVLSVPDAIAQAIAVREVEKAGIQQELMPEAELGGVPVAGKGAGGRGTPVEIQRGPQMEFAAYDVGETFIGTCPDCASQLEFAEGCMKCHMCGYSDCG
jgi:ribonucleoside-diphosphate reductase alpha chain